MIFRPNPKSNLNTLYVVMTSRRYLSHVVHFLKVLTHRLPLRLTEPTVTQFFTITYQNFHQSPARCTHPSTGNHRIADPQTKIQTYSTTNKQYTTNIIIPVLHVAVTSTPTVTSLPLHNAYSKTYIINLH